MHVPQTSRWSNHHFSYSLRYTEQNLNSAFDKLSSKIAYLQQNLKSFYSINNIYIGGGTSRAILDYIFYGESLKMRDIDVFINFGKTCDEDTARQIGNRLNSPILGQYSSSDLRPRPRAHPSKNHDYNAGYGFFLINEEREILDISIFHSQEDLYLNGIFNIDKIMIPLSDASDLNAFRKKIVNLKYREILQQKLIYDPYNGYKNWRGKKGRIINWDCVKNDPIVITIRIVRTYAKLKYKELPLSVYKQIMKLLNNVVNYDVLQLKRNLEKISADENSDWTFSILDKLGILKHA